MIGERGGPLCLLMGPTPETHISCINTIWKVKEKTIARQSESEIQVKVIAIDFRLKSKNRKGKEGEDHYGGC